MGQYKVNLTLWLDAEDKDDLDRQLKALLIKQQWQMSALYPVDFSQPALAPQPVVANVQTPTAERYVTYRVADEKFRVFARDFGLQGTELKVPKNKDFLQFRVRAFLEGLGYQVEPKTSIRVVAESHVESGPVNEAMMSVQESADNAGEYVYIKRD